MKAAPPLHLGLLPREGAECATGARLVCTPVGAPPHRHGLCRGLQTLSL